MASHGEFFSGNRIEKEVVDDTMVRRVETSDNGVMVRESESWENWDETSESFCTVCDKTVDVGS
jgi:hypothetical protein